MKIYKILFFYCLLVMWSSIGYAKENTPPILPEPMVFDLILPLGKPRNTVEINTLFQYNFSEDEAHYNPEIEYTFLDGYAVELEFPMVNTTLDAYKFALQGTFNFLQTSKFIHGWQYYGEYHRHTKALENDVLYLFGYQFDEKWSTLNMAGVRYTDVRERGHVDGLLNSNLFYKALPWVTMGLEMNWVARSDDRPDKVLIMPQLHLLFAKASTLQLGFGVKNEGDESSAHAASRLIFNF